MSTHGLVLPLFQNTGGYFLKPCRKFNIIPLWPCRPFFQHTGFFSDNFLCIFTFLQIILHQSKSYFWSITSLLKQYNSQDLPHRKIFRILNENAHMPIKVIQPSNFGPKGILQKSVFPIHSLQILQILSIMQMLHYANG